MPTVKRFYHCVAVTIATDTYIYIDIETLNHGPDMIATDAEELSPCKGEDEGHPHSWFKKEKVKLLTKKSSLGGKHFF